MQDSSLLRLLGSLSPRQMKDLDVFLQSPYHNTNQTIHKLFRYIKRYHPDMDNAKLSRQHAFFHLFPESAFKDAAIRKQMSLLKSAVEEFVKIDQLRQSEALQQRLLIQHYYSSESHENFSGRILQSMDDLKKQPHRDAQFHLEMLWLHEELFYHPHNKEHQYHHSNGSLQDLTQHLDLFYLLYKLRLETDFNIRKNVLSEKIAGVLPFDQIKKFLPAVKVSEEPLFWIYLQLYHFQQRDWEADPVELSQLFDTFQGFLDQLGPKERGFMLNVMINIAVAHVNKDERFAALVTRLFRFGHEKDLILYQGQVSPLAFLNATIISSGIGEFGFVKEFIDHYEKFIVDEDKAVIVQFSWGAWNYHQSKAPGLSVARKKELLDEALNQVITIPHAPFANDLRIRSLLFRIYYDLYLLGDMEKEVFVNNARSFQKYLKDKTDVFGKKTGAYIAFISYCKKLAEIYRSYAGGKPNPKALDELSKKINEDQDVALKIWLQKEAGELLKLPPP